MPKIKNIALEGEGGLSFAKTRRQNVQGCGRFAIDGRFLGFQGFVA